MSEDKALKTLDEIEQLVIHLKAENKALRKICDRYWWLRNSDHWPAAFPNSDYPEPLRGDALDVAIDKAMNK